jgi:hypothetical protein
LEGFFKKEEHKEDDMIDETEEALNRNESQEEKEKDKDVY